MALTSYEANDIVANSRRNPLEVWRRLQKRYDPTTGGNETCCARSFLLDGALVWNLQAGIERCNSYVSRCEKKMKDNLDDEIKLAGLESSVPEELEKHLFLNSNRLRTFEDARLEIVTYVEAKFGLRIRDPKTPVTRVLVDTQISWMWMRSTLSRSSGNGKGSSSPRDGCFLSALVHIFNEIAMHARA